MYFERINPLQVPGDQIALLSNFWHCALSFLVALSDFLLSMVLILKDMFALILIPLCTCILHTQQIFTLSSCTHRIVLIPEEKPYALLKALCLCPPWSYYFVGLQHISTPTWTPCWVIWGRKNKWKYWKAVPSMTEFLYTEICLAPDFSQLAFP